MKFLVLPRRVKGVCVAAALAACVALTAMPATATGPAARRLAQGTPLPDLTVGVDRLRTSLIISNRTFSANSCSFVEGCIAETGSRRILQFDMQIINQGNADAVLGRPQDNPELFEFSPCHGHYHMSDTLDYSMAKTGRDSIGVYNSSTATFFLKNRNDNGVADVSFVFGGAGAVPITGDWDGDGDATIGIYVPATGAFFLRNSNTPGNADITFTFGAANAGYVPVVGDWDGTNTDTVGLYDPAAGVFFLKNANSNGPADLTFAFGAAGGYTPVAGDWDNDDVDSVGLYQAATGAFFLRNANSAGVADATFFYGTGGTLKPVVGDWDLDGADSIGLFQPATGGYFLRNVNDSGPADSTFIFGSGGADVVQIANDWDYDQEADSLPGYTGLKQAFCWLDSQRVFGSAPPRYNCSNQGITQGWSDIYGRSLDCQWIDITGLAAGKYQLRVSVNDSQALLAESDYTNNFVALKVRITPAAAAVKAPTVRVTSPSGGERFKVGRPVTITWEITDPENITHQEVWFLPIDKDHPSNKHGSPKEDAIARAKLLVENLPASARSFTWVPTEDYLGGPGAFLVRTTDSVNMVGADSISKGRIRVKK